ncbi:MAG: hypothetical protein L6R40_006189 [Gallowayella cf. fulva]|nr:MAG: hypothetical protein L6R40_006189 [Xanthomendoza cf. fulva]
MERNIRASSAPLLGSGAMTPLAREAEEKEKGGEGYPARYPARSAGCVFDDHSPGMTDWQDNRRRIDELEEFARTTPPDPMANKPTFPNGKAATELARTDSGRRRGILEHMSGTGGAGGLPPKPIKRLFRMNRSVTSSDVGGEQMSRGSMDGKYMKNIPRGSMEIASKHSSGGRKYMKIAVNPRMYRLDNPSTYKVNFKDKSHKWIHRNSQPRTGPELDGSTSNDHDKKGVQQQHTHLNLERDRCDPAAKTGMGTGQANNGLSPSKRIPKPELGVRDFAAATLAIAHARARGTAIIGPVSSSPERGGEKQRYHSGQCDGLVSPHEMQEIRKRGIQLAHRKRTSSTQPPHSIPLKLQLRPQRTSVPQTPRTSLAEHPILKATYPVSPVPPISPPGSPGPPISPVVNVTAKSSPGKSGSSVADDLQSDAESGKIMNAQSAEVIQGQGSFAYYTRSSRQPPKPGPAPTRALPSLPEGHDAATPTSIKVEHKTLLASDPPSACGSSPKQKSAKSPPKRHRYRLSPVKNTMPTDSRIPFRLKPSPTFTEEFPQPPRTALPAMTARSPAPDMPARHGETADNEVVGGRLLPTPLMDDTAASHGARDDLKLSNGLYVPLVVASHTSPPERPDEPIQLSKDAEENNHYIPWQESREERVKALKARDMERLRAQQTGAAGQESNNEKLDAAGEERYQDMQTDNPTEAKQLPNSQSPSALGTKDPPLLQPIKTTAEEENRRSIISTNNDFSPIIVVADQPPSAANHPRLPSPNHLSTIPDPSDQYPDYLGQPTSTFKPNGIVHPHHQQHAHPSSSPNLLPNRTPSYSSTFRLPQDPHPPRHSNSSFTPTINAPTDIEARLEARIAAMERKNLLLERAFLAVIDATSGFSLGLGDRRDSYMSGEDAGDRFPGEDVRRRRSRGEGQGKRLSGASEGLAPLAGRLDDMLMSMQRRGGGGMG